MQRTKVLLAAAATMLSAIHAEAAGALLAHRAIYDLDLGQSSERSGVVGVAGRIVYEFNGSACDGYSTNYRFVTQLNMRESQRTNDYQITTFEGPEGKSFDFVTRFFVDRKLDQETKGSAQGGPGGVKVSLQKPEAKTVELPVTHFPTQHTQDLIDKAKAGETFYETTMYDGSDTGDKVVTTTVIIGRKTEPSKDDPEVATLKEMSDDPYWPISIAYFDIAGAGGEEVPASAMNFKLYENGFTRDMEISYGEFSVKARLVALEVLKPTGNCLR